MLKSIKFKEIEFKILSSPDRKTFLNNLKNVY